MQLYEIIDGCERYEKNAQSALYAKYSELVLNTCLRYAKNKAQADEMFTEVLLSIYTGFKMIDIDAFDFWLKEMVNTKIIEILKRNKQEYKVMSTATANEVVGEYDKLNDDEIIAVMNSKDVLIAIQSLSPAYRVVVNLHLIEGYSVKQISEKLDIGEATVKTNYDNAMFQLRKKIVQLTTAAHA